MNKVKWPAITAFAASLGIITFLFTKKELTIRFLSDTFFLTALFFFIIGIALWIMSSGFFDNFQRSMKQAFKRKKNNEPKEFIPLSEIGKAHQLYWLTTGGILLTIAMVFLLFYFL